MIVEISELRSDAQAAHREGLLPLRRMGAELRRGRENQVFVESARNKAGRGQSHAKTLKYRLRSEFLLQDFVNPKSQGRATQKLLGGTVNVT
ncbi:hypothetical protein GCM10010911_56110 [Paenibacillus nasutitermitis]|uniref:Uncharacterized protein n=1 Tax=Paenibacillus nasutitermitis TaxID=1652958 RepID=A0A917E121_9BACL|nr:hypothetical protein GCM10010911_56110 [Paenibacillus nasutitermitis]